MFKTLMDKVDAMQGQIGDLSRELWNCKNEPQGIARNEEHCNRDKECLQKVQL